VARDDLLRKKREEKPMVTISRVYKGKRIRSSGATRSDALANLERSIRWLDRFAWLKRVTDAASMMLKPRTAALLLRRTLGIQ
jgi:hypothetical protein